VKKAKGEDMTKIIWQIKAGDGERHYPEVFLDCGVMLLGPGTKWGDYHKHRKDYENEKDITPTIRRSLRQFADEVNEKAAELVVLKILAGGTKWAAVAVGKITSEYDFKSAFSDVEGFELQHCRRVDWRETATKTIPGLGRGGGPFCHVKNERARKKVEQLWADGESIKPDQIPPDPEILTDENLVDSLAKVKNCGRRNAKLIADTILRLRRLANWYEKNDKDYDVKEHETRTFLVIPLIMSLGWVEENVKIEWNHRDVALFGAPYSKEDEPEPIVIIETKALWDGLGNATKQAQEYAGPYKTCKKVVVTDGIRYKLYKRPKHGEAWPLTAYLNLLTPTCNHPYEPRVGGAVAFFQEMIPKAAI